MIGDGDPPAARRRAHRHHAADVPRQRAADAVLEHFDAFLAGRVADGDERRAVVQPLRQPIPDAVGDAELADCALPEREGEQLPARVDGEAVACRMHVVRAEVVRRRDELARRLRAMRRHLDVDPRGALRRGIEQPDVGAALIDDALAVGLRVARVEVVVIGVPAHVGSVRQARVEIADAFGIGQVVDAPADPHRARQVARELRHAAERPGPGRIDPQMAGRSAAVALPARRIRRVPADDPRVAGTEREVVDLAVAAAFAACRRRDRACRRGSCGRRAARRWSRTGCAPRASIRAR